MTGYVVDASVAAKWLGAEMYSGQAALLLDAEFTLIGPERLFAEAANALWAMSRRGDMSEADLAEATDVLKAAPVRTPVSMRDLTPSASRLGVDLDHPVYDCFYLALAVREHYPVVTADRRFFDVVRKHPYLSDRIVHVKDLE